MMEREYLDFSVRWMIKFRICGLDSAQRILEE